MTHAPILITGSSGFLGRRLVRAATTENQVLAVTHRQSREASGSVSVSMDVTDESMVARLVDRERPSAIIHAAAVNPGQGDDTTMWRVNVDGSRNVAKAAAEVGARFIAVSTDVVHDGTRAPYGDDIAPTPLQAYGRSKAEAESAIRSVNADAAIVRSSLIYAVDEIDRGTAGFVDSITRGERLLLFSDVLRNPVWVETLAEAILRLVTVDYRGLLNVAGHQVLSREQFGLKMLEFWGIADRGLVDSGRASDVSASIPLDLRLDLTRAESLLDMAFPGVDEVLESHPPEAIHDELAG